MTPTSSDTVDDARDIVDARDAIDVRAGIVDVSVVVPCHGCAATLPALVQGVAAALRPRDVRIEFVLVADGSDDDAAAIAGVAVDRSDVVAVVLDRQRGQHAAIAAGLSRARGAEIVVMDGDLQHQPSDVPRLLDALGDTDVVVAHRTSRTEGIVVRAGSWLFFRTLSVVLGVPVDPQLCSFSALRRAVVDALPPDRGGPRHHLLELWSSGARWRALPVSFAPRAAGQSRYSFASRCRLALDLWRLARSLRRGPQLPRSSVPSPPSSSSPR